MSERFQFSEKNCVCTLHFHLFALVPIYRTCTHSRLNFQLKGSIDDCTCNVDTVDYFNNMKIYPRIQSLLVRDYFRFYKVNLKQDCPFWADDSKCAIRYCHVLPCRDVSIIFAQYLWFRRIHCHFFQDDIPEGLKGEIPRNIHSNESPADKYKTNAQSTDCSRSARDHDIELGYLNTTIR